jgi:hypothetical protein
MADVLVDAMLVELQMALHTRGQHSERLVALHGFRTLFQNGVLICLLLYALSKLRA